MTKVTLRQKVNRKFGSWHNFARLVGLDLLKGKTPQEIDRIVDALPRSPGAGALTKAKIEGLRRALNEAGGVAAFCEANQEYSESSLWQILQGRRKRMSPVIVRLLTHFGL